ncbi:MAG: VOC family protein [Actinomycetota bacterium]
MTKLHTYLNFDGKAEEAFEFYKSVFGGEFTQFVRFKDFPMEGMTIPEEEGAKMIHISLPIGDSTVLMASDILESLGQTFVQGNSVYISIDPSSKEEADKLFNGLSQGGDVEMPIADQAWGDYFGSFKDKFGVCWMVNFSQSRS